MKRISTASALFALFFITFAGISCSKIDTTDIGAGLIPVVDNVNTFELVLNTLTDNKLFSDSTRMLTGEDHAVGIIESDPEFGKTTAVLYSSFSMPAYRRYPFVNRDTVIVDSVVLSLGFTELYGDSTALQTFEVREIDTRFVPFKDSLYFLHSPELAVKEELLAAQQVSFTTLNDSVFYRNAGDTIRSGKELRIKLDTSWARRFINYDTSGAYNNDSLFHQAFPGFEVRTSEGSAAKSALAYFNLGDNQRTRVTFYCRIQNMGRTDTIAPFFIYNFGPHANRIIRTPAGNYADNVTNEDPSDEKLYIQSTPGSFVTVKIPGLDTLGNRVIHRAELILEKFPSDDQQFATPDVLFIDALSSTGDSAFTLRNDFIPSQTSPGYDLNLLGGTFRNNQYVFNITRYVQSIVTKQFPNRTLRVYAPFTAQPFYTIPNSDMFSGRVGLIINDPVASGRVVLYGGAAIDPKRLRLRIIYSRI